MFYVTKKKSDWCNMNEFDAPWKYGVLFKPFDCGRASIFAAITNLK